MTDNQRKKARQQMKEWLTLTRGSKTKAERVKKWREIVRDILQDAGIRKAAAERARTRPARRKMLAAKFEGYR